MGPMIDQKLEDIDRCIVQKDITYYPCRKQHDIISNFNLKTHSFTELNPLDKQNIE